MIEHNYNRVQQQTLNGVLKANPGEPQHMVERRIRAQLPNRGEGWEVSIHHSGVMSRYEAKKVQK
jgi:phosphopantetheinyl transferase